MEQNFKIKIMGIDVPTAPSKKGTCSAYAYAKACGIIGKSFLGRRLSLLTGLHSLNELDRLIFPGSYKELPGNELLHDMEKRLVNRAARQISVIVNAYEDVPELLIRMLRLYEYNDLKICFQNLAAGKKERPSICDIGRYKTIRFEAFPDIKTMLRGTEFEFLLSEYKNLQSSNIDYVSIESQLDRHYYQNLLNYLKYIPVDDRKIASQIIADEIRLRNCVWAFRLRTYYQKTVKQTEKYLMDIKIPGHKHNEEISLAEDALASLAFPLDSPSFWENWKWRKFLNPQVYGSHWSLDPRYFQNAVTKYLYRLTLQCFHKMPLSVSSIFCFIRLKQYEEIILTSVCEGLALGLDSTSVFKLLEGY